VEGDGSSPTPDRWLMHPSRHPGFDIPARLTGAGAPSEDSANWLVVCRRCGWHVETVYGHCWGGCPGCGAELWVLWPDGQSPGPEWPDGIMLATEYHDDFRARRRRNAWRTSHPTAALA
jgi:hypothetical protein